MLVSNKQTLVMLDVFKASLSISGTFGGYSLEIRKKVVHEIINQQSNDLVDLMIEDTYRDWQKPQDNSLLEFVEEETEELLDEVMKEAEEILRQSQKDKKCQDNEAMCLPCDALLKLVKRVQYDFKCRKSDRLIDGRTREARAIYKTIQAVENIIQSESNCPLLWLKAADRLQELYLDRGWRNSRSLNELIEGIRNCLDRGSENQQF